MNMRVERQHVMQVMDPTGHTTVTWDPDDRESVADARKEFNRLRDAGYSAFRMNAVDNGVYSSMTISVAQMYVVVDVVVAAGKIIVDAELVA